jgi:hypothetical protein
MNSYECPFCGYEGKETEFSEHVCPACCVDQETGERVVGSMPTVFHLPTARAATAIGKEG